MKIKDNKVVFYVFIRIFIIVVLILIGILLEEKINNVLVENISLKGENILELFF